MEASTSESTSSRSKPTYRVAVSLKIPDCSSDDDNEVTKDYDSHRPKSCPHATEGLRSLSSTIDDDDALMIKEKELSLMRNQSNVELLTTPQRDQFDAFVSKCTGPWRDDLVHYPATEEDIDRHPDVYNFEHAGRWQVMSVDYGEHPIMHGKASSI
ncbi:hypothetical protein Pmar_PMAR028521 [Perkinsus marinus ATCC 50983]|uniref:Uncharacterized protein n=1 Tax=Perkinsus marinus (strain ATCC 50983 / TXsc) TaxID=423536 RepID=C5LMD0_PERM5|nr:hypothetical protein Pmar_PMAR028521 [Perkinsus marinus ATCC 50983]EER02142.1 hypothetical protein Pmar_PMAR028521 [Perkinsus marinus ATCC 50983]|eukprot:XP_002769424.1 hypothetical protein Pmar_PMAR028521 [Perkinsus marinus ATCC 50983]